uniref:protein ECT2-like isoform X2 n=1 Tax=Styela clava TaxID=7725 RepID=UPI00193971C9|nr:protein ECT2-like isoform X2 [Styela clava]
MVSYYSITTYRVKYIMFLSLFSNGNNSVNIIECSGIIFCRTYNYSVKNCNKSIMDANKYMIATGGLSGVSVFLHLISAGNFLPDEEVWLLGTVFWYIHYWLNVTARMLLLSSAVMTGLEIYKPNMIGSYTSMNSRMQKKYVTKMLAVATFCIFIRFVLPGPVTSFGRLYKLCFMTSLSAAVITVVEANESGGGGGSPFKRSDSISGAAPTKRQLTAMELLQTETTYIRNLKIIIEIYKQPLENAIKTGEPILAAEDIRNIFGGISDILKVHSEMHQELSEMISEWQEDCCIAGIITKYQSQLTKVYPPYVNYFDMGKDIILKQKKSNNAFSEFLINCFNNPTCLKQPLDALLIRPVQRLPSMSLLINDMQRRTPEDLKDHTELGKAKDSLKQVLSHINEDKRKTEGKMKIFDIIYEVEFCPVEIVSSNRLFICRVNVTTSNEGLYRTGDRLALYLLTDMIEVSKFKRSPGRNSPLLKHIRTIPLTSIKSVIDINDTEESQNMFAIHLENEHSDKINGNGNAAHSNPNMDKMCVCQVLDDRTYKEAFLKKLNEQILKTSEKDNNEPLMKKMDPSEVQPLLRKGSHRVFRRTRSKTKRD